MSRVVLFPHIIFIQGSSQINKMMMWYSVVPFQVEGAWKFHRVATFKDQLKIVSGYLNQEVLAWLILNLATQMHTDFPHK